MDLPNPFLVAPADSPFRRRSTCRAGLTLIEMLIAVALTLILVFALVRVFQLLGDNVRDSRAILDLAGQLRMVSQQLQQDLDQITVPTLPTVQPESGLGYFEYVEGINKDYWQDDDNDGVRDPNEIITQKSDSSIGDRDDVLAFTARSGDRKFVGVISGIWNPATLSLEYQPGPNAPKHTIESSMAEIIWWCQRNPSPAPGQPPPETYSVFRRVVLIRPDIRINVGATFNPDQFAQFMQDNDLSVRADPSAPGVFTNHLGDLSKREYRYAHIASNVSSPVPGGYPFLINLQRVHINNPAGPSFIDFERRGQFLIMGDALAFDVRAYDPQVPYLQAGGVFLLPHDPGYHDTNVAQLINPPPRGGYVDLNYVMPNDPNSAPISQFSHPASVKSGLKDRRFGVYDTWPTHYERDGHNQVDGKYINSDPANADEATNGLDDDGVNGVDDSGEFETAAPYPYPLRGIEVTLRMLEFNTRQVRQSSVVADFTPE